METQGTKGQVSALEGHLNPVEETDTCTNDTLGLGVKEWFLS